MCETIELQITDLLNYLNFYKNDFDLIVKSIFDDFDYNSSQMEIIVIEAFRENKKAIEFNYEKTIFKELCRFLFFFDKIIINYGTIVVEFNKN